MRTLKYTVVGALSAVLLLGACGGSSDSTSSDAKAKATTTSTAKSTSETFSPKGPSGEVPDACTLVSDAQLTAALGSSPGTGTVQGPVPDQRKICRFDNGVILAVEVAANYDASVAMIRQNSGGATITEVPGVGTAAIWQDFGNGLGQVVAKGDDYLVGVTVPVGGQAAASAVAKDMLAAL